MKTLIFDGHNAMWRIQKRLPELVTPRGRPIQVVYGFLRLLRSAIEQFEPADMALVCWDNGTPEWRRKLDPQYKAERIRKRKMFTTGEKEEYRRAMEQLETVKKLLPYLGVRQLEVENMEGDDLIAVACSEELRGTKVVISSDKDLLQLVCDKVDVWSPIKQELFTAKNFHRLVGLTVRQWLEFRAIVGDTGDGVPSAARGFGEQSARDLISRYGSIEELYRPTVERRVSKERARYALLYEEGVRDRIDLNLKLIDLRMVPSEKIIDALRKTLGQDVRVDAAFLKRYFMEHAFVSLLKDFGRWVTPFRTLGGE